MPVPSSFIRLVVNLIFRQEIRLRKSRQGNYVGTASIERHCSAIIRMDCIGRIGCIGRYCYSLFEWTVLAVLAVLVGIFIPLFEWSVTASIDVHNCPPIYA